jgi:hypothetical protein
MRAAAFPGRDVVKVKYTPDIEGNVSSTFEESQVSPRIADLG